MDQSKRSSEVQPPPPYSQDDGQQNPYGQQNPDGQNNNSSPHYGLSVGPGNIAVVSPAGQYNDMGQGHPEDQQQQWAPPLPPDYSTGLEDTGCFDDKAIRRGFIKKVYLTLMIQLLLTFGIICAFLYWEALRVWSMNTYWFSYCMIAVVLVIIVALSCCADVRRKVPLNFLALGLFTIAEGLLLGSVTVFYEAEAVMWAVGATALVSLALSVFAMQSRWDFTLASGGLWVFCWTLISFALLCGIMRSQYLYIVYACLGTLLFSLYLVMDTQLILGGNHKYSISPEEYVFAALNLYLDIVSLFTMLLSLIGLCR
ncbi:protein lifeguard 1 [Salvelinus namaycush]|uniref:Protein lifeguard 1 n=1 Tax=Salvelinus namaycush TaxID=8040 RepID=A0A8U0Q8T7_SALNM|nr:protein lifeguard 1 [Salvelinus namaycush]